MATSKPVIVLVHGAWHSPEHLAPLEANLRAHGYKTNSVWLPSMHYSRVNPPLDPAKVNLLDDISAIRKTVIDELSSNSTANVTVLSHSYGAIPASSAIENLDKVTRTKEGFNNSVTALLIISGLMVPAGITALEWAGGQIPPTVSLSTIPSPSDPAREIQVSTPVSDPGPIALFYHDLPDQEEAKRYAQLCTHQLWSVNTTVIPFVGWKNPSLDVFYLVCEEDRALPTGFQRVMIDAADQARASAENNVPGSSVEDDANGSVSSQHGGDLLEKFQKDSLAAIEESKAILEGVKAGNEEGATAEDGGAAEKGEQDGATGAGTKKVHVTSIQSGHSPFLSRLEETAQWVRRSSGEEV